MTPNYSCLLIDLDGTIFDFEAAERRAIIETFEVLGLEVSEENAALYSQINNSLWKAHEKKQVRKDRLVLQRFEQFLEKTGQKASPGQMHKAYASRLAEYGQPFPGAKELLAELAEFATLAAITNGLYAVQTSRLQKSGLGIYFDDVFISEKMNCTKPDARFFNLALDKLGIKNKSRVLVVGDSLSADIQGGINAGLATCWCNFNNQPEPENITPTYIVNNYGRLKLAAIGEEALKDAETREKRHVL